MKNNYSRQIGLTLIEVLIALVATATITLIVTSTYINILSVSNRTRTATQAQQLVDQLLLQITQQVQFSSAISSPDTSTLNISITNPVPQNITYLWNGSTTLTQTIDANPSVTINPNNFTITNFQVIPRSDPTASAIGYEITITVQYNTHSPTQPLGTYTATTAVSQRNHFPT